MTEVTTIALFNDAARVGKTTLAYHLSHMLARLGYPVVAADLDPQANLTSAFFDEERMERLWEGEGSTILTAVDPLIRGIGDVKLVDAAPIADRLCLLPATWASAASRTGCRRPGPSAPSAMRPRCAGPRLSTGSWAMPPTRWAPWP